MLNRNFLLVTAANFFFFLNFASFFLLPIHIKEMGGSEAVVGIVMGLAGLASLVILPVIGMTIDRLGRRLFLLLGASGMTLIALGFAWVDTIGPPLFALRLMQGLCFAAAFTATTTFAVDFSPPGRRAQALGFFGLSSLLTHALAPSIGEEIILRGGFRTLFLCAAFYSAVSCVIALALPPAPAPSLDTAAHGTGRFQPLQIVIALTTMLAGMGFGTVITFIPTFMRTEGLGRVAFFFAAYTSAAILTRIVGAGLSDSVGRRRVILPTLIALSIAILILASAHTLPVLVLAGAVFGTAQGINYPTLHAFLVDHSPVAFLGRAQALFNGAFNFGVTSSAFAFGWIAEHFGYRPMFVLAAIAPLLGAGIFYQFAPRTGSVDFIEKNTSTRMS